MQCFQRGDKAACAQSSVPHGFGDPGGGSFSVQGGKDAKGKGAESDFYYNHSCQHIIDTVNGARDVSECATGSEGGASSHLAALVRLLGFHRPLHRLVLSDALVMGEGILTSSSKLVLTQLLLSFLIRHRISW